MSAYFKVFIGNRHQPAGQHAEAPGYWSIPADGCPGCWREAPGPVGYYRQGLCLNSLADPALLVSGSTIYLAEVDGEREDKGGGWVFAQRARLLRRLPWDAVMARRFALAVAERGMAHLTGDYQAALAIARELVAGRAMTGARTRRWHALDRLVVLEDTAEGQWRIAAQATIAPTAWQAAVMASTAGWRAAWFGAGGSMADYATWRQADPARDAEIGWQRSWLAHEFGLTCQAVAS